jgi:hypothetical protein
MKKFSYIAYLAVCTDDEVLWKWERHEASELQFREAITSNTYRRIH